MNRTEIIQKIIDKKKARTYLEIGVDAGINFIPIKIIHKIAVDPNLVFSTRKRLVWAFKNIYNLIAKYYIISSDSFFANAKSTCLLDVVFIDGLHTYQQSLKDVNNSLKRLKENGVIILHDCNPPNEAAAYPADSFDHAASLKLPGWTSAWCGDVWKTICYLRSNKRDLRIFVLDCDCGLGIITRGETDNYLNLKEQDVSKMTYDDLVHTKKQLLNLKDVNFFFEFLKTI